MKYRVSNLPGTSNEVRYKIQTLKGDKESCFGFSDALIDVWGNPMLSKLKTLMIAYVKRHGWSANLVKMDDKNSPRSLSCYIAEIPKSKA